MLKKISPPKPLPQAVDTIRISKPALSSADVAKLNHLVEAKRPVRLLCDIIKSSRRMSTADLSEKIKEALNLGASPNEISSSGNPALSILCSQGRPLLVRQLLEAGADVNAKCVPDGWTSLHVCAVGNNLPLTAILLEFGADESQVNQMMNTALDCARYVQSTLWAENIGPMLSARSAMQAINEIVDKAVFANTINETEIHENATNSIPMIKTENDNVISSTSRLRFRSMNRL